MYYNDEDKIIIHYGVKRRSGRYPWGSGEDPYQHSGDFLSRVEELKKSGKTEKEIAKEIGLSTTEYRIQIQLAKHERRQLEVDRAKSLRSDGKSLNEIAQIMGYNNDSSIRSLLNENTAYNKNLAKNVSEILKKELDNKGVIDVGAGVERELGITKQKLAEAIYILELEGYNHYGIGVPNVTDKTKRTIYNVLAKKDITQGDIYNDVSLIKPVTDYHSVDGGKTWDKIEYPSSISSDRVFIKYGDKGGSSKDGTIEIRKGVEDLNLGNSHYAQVRIMVDGTHYLKGMALYSDDIPDGYDIVFNTNKKSGTEKEKVFKEISNDKDNPFGALIKANGQSYYIDKNGNKKLSAINKLKEEGDWDEMSRTLSSQFLSKQPVDLINKQLDLTYKDYVSEFDTINSLTNPTIKRKLLLDFADQCDSATIHLKAASLPRQSSKVILPIDSMKDTEVYAPTYNNGEKVVLIRYPHGGIFEIPMLTVNNNNRTARSILGSAKDAIGINSKVAEILSGADFDGDSVTVIPVSNKVRINVSEPLKDLKDFDPKVVYSSEGKKNVKLMSKGSIQREMGVISNLITDMTLRGADESEIARAVKHSMVVIDAYKHKLDYKRSEKENGIQELKKSYQTYIDSDGNIKTGGASTLLSRRKNTVDVNERRGSPRIDPITGKVSYKESGRTYIDKKTGEIVKAKTKINLIDLVDDVRVLSSGTVQEEAYANYANRMKDLAAKARIEYTKTGRLEKDPNASKIYSKEVKDLNNKLDIASRNAPRERQAQVLANTVVKAKVQEDPMLELDKKALKKTRQIAINDARNKVGAKGKETKINITDDEWKAIQAGAISDSKLSEILKYSDPDRVRSLAMPKQSTTLSQAKIDKIRAMQASGYLLSEIAESVGYSVSTVSKYLN